MSYSLFLDDFRMPEDTFNYTGNPIYNKESWIIVRNYNQFVEYIQKNGIPEKISFDHDLADVHYLCQNDIDYDRFAEKTGYDCAKWLINYCMDNNEKLPPVILIHSMNTVGVKNIKSLFETYIKVHGE